MLKFNAPKSTFTKVPISEATAVPKIGGFYDLTTNSWWAATDDDCLLFYGRGDNVRGKSRQCSSNKGITDRFVASETHPSTKAVFLEAVWMPHDCNDYL